MKKITLSMLIIYCLNTNKSFAKNDFDPIRQIQIDAINWQIDNPKGKIKIRFVKNEDKSDTTNRPKGFFGKLKSVVNMIMNASDNPPFRVEIIREKEKKS
ncbi:MAG: hypothetical protein RLZZ306_1669 [Bacteroidota bacterium]|jgi:hypothetical protein